MIDLHTYKKWIANKIKTAREEVGISLEEIAERSKLSADYLERLEDGDVSPSNLVRTKLAKALELDSEYFEGMPEE
jgi:transcriptional regulator with XRE-family HTH domain